MPQISRFAGTTSQTIEVFIRDSASTTGGGKAGLAYNTAGLTAYYVRTRSAPVAITLATQTPTGGWSSGGFAEIDSTNTPGLYRLDVPDAAIASGSDKVTFQLKGATGMAVTPLLVELTANNNQSAVCDANLKQILGTALTETAGQIAGGFKKLFDVASPVLTAASINQTGDSFARIGAAGAGLTALGDTRLANLDAAVSSRSTYAGGAVASVTAGVTVTTNNDKTGYSLSSGGIQAIWDALTSALTTVGSIGKLLVDNINATISSRSTYSGGAVASVTGAVGSVTGNVGGNVVGSVGSVSSGVTVTTNNDKTGYGLSSAAVQAIWDAATSALSTVGSIGKWILDKLDVVVSTRSTYSGGDTSGVTTLLSRVPGTVQPQTGDAYARIGVAGAGLTNLGDSRIANLDAAVSSRSTFAGGSVASVTAPVTVGTNNDKTGYDLASTSIQAIWDKATSALTAAGSIGKWILDKLDVVLSTRSTYAGGAVASVTGSVGSVTSPVNITAVFKKNTAVPVWVFHMVQTDGVTPLVGVAITAERRLDAGGYAACANSVVELDGGDFRIAFAATDTNCDVGTFRFSGTGGRTLIQSFVFQP